MERLSLEETALDLPVIIGKVAEQMQLHAYRELLGQEVPSKTEQCSRTAVIVYDDLEGPVPVVPEVVVGGDRYNHIGVPCLNSL